MDVNIKKLPKSLVEIDVELAPEELESYRKKTALQLSQSLEVKGFRKGSVPAEILENHLGKEKFFKEVVDTAIKESFAKIAVENNLDVISQPQIEILKIAPKNPLIFKINAPIMPEVDVADYKNIKITVAPVEINDKEIDSALKTLQKSRADYSNANRPAQKGDRVEIDFTATLNGALIDGGESKQHPLILGEEHFMPGFEKELEGLKEKEEKEFFLTTPDDYFQKNLAGKNLNFKVKMLLVQKVKLPELNDEFAQKLGKFSSIDDLKKNVKEGLGEEKKKREQEKTRLKIIEAIVSKTSFDLPEQLIKEELNKMESEFSSSLARINIDEESYLSQLKKKKEDLRKDWQEQAKKRVCSALALREIANREGITVSKEEIENKAQEFLKMVPNIKEAKNIDLQVLQNYVKGIIRNEKVFELLEKNVIKS